MININNMNFYDFMHKQIPVLLLLFSITGLGYLYIGYIYSNFYLELLWYSLILMVSIWGLKLYLRYKNNDLSLEEKESWLTQLRYFLFIYFSLWTIIFVIYITNSDIKLHYIAIATQFGCGVVSATILVSQRKLAIFTLVSLMFPLFLYFLSINEFYSFLIAFYTFVVSLVLLYAASNTHSYLVKSQFQAYHDYLTKLGNRRYFIELLEDNLKIQKQTKKPIYLILIDLDHFKNINDTLGHDVGDQLLIEVSKRMSILSKKFRSHVARLGGDEFCIVSPFFKTNEESQKHAQEFSLQLLEKIKEPYLIEDHKLFISASMGITDIKATDINATIFLKEADIAMYESKNNGRDGITKFSDNLEKQIKFKLEAEQLLHFALANNEITLYFQPKYSIKEQHYSCEVLARWNNSILGEVDSTVFIPMAEMNGLIIDIGNYILEESLKKFIQCKEKMYNLQTISINLSIKQLLYKNFVDYVDMLFKKYNITQSLANNIIFEITETIEADNIQLLKNNILQLKELGVKFSLDDFGTGYSSLSYLKDLNVDEIKIDKSFIQEYQQNNYMIKTIINIAKSFNMNCVAEGVETKEQYDYLLEKGCDIIQGYYISKPLNVEDFEKFIQSKS